MYKELIKKRINFNFSKQKLMFDVSQSLFSSTNIDEGTKALLNSLRKNEKIKYESILDLGGGYGIIGIFLKKQNPDAEVECVDRDALAIEFSKHNAEVNNCKIKVYGSLGYQEVGGKFDLIVCNFPAKAGEKALEDFVYNASWHLHENGIFAIVIVKELEKEFEKSLNQDINVLYKQKTSGHIIYHLGYKKEIKSEEDPYYRKNVNFHIDNKNYKLKTAVNVNEFISQHYSTMCILGLIKKLEAKEPVIIEPFQGHVAIGVMHYMKPKKITLVSRDLLSLRYSEKNLIENGERQVNVVHTPHLSENLGDLVIWRIDEKEEKKVFQLKFNLLKKNYKRIVIAGKKGQLGRFLKRKIKKEFEKENYKAILLEN
jgi:SAM-dependent methyltransferase